MYDSPRVRRLRSDLSALERLRDESSVLRFSAAGPLPNVYSIRFQGKGLARVRGRVAITESHDVEIKLGASYPRTMPEIRWLSPVYHPNISEIGMVCLGGYGTHWVPGLNLDELCVMLWDMARYHNYDVRSPYNRDAALWVANQTKLTFPLDPRPLRDLRAALGRVEPGSHVAESPGTFAQEVETPGTRTARYADFVRRFASELRSITPRTPPPAGAEESIVLSELVNTRARIEEAESPARLRAADEEIVFIE
jgi:Ubiquitin-conjugating enzyme